MLNRLSTSTINPANPAEGEHGFDLREGIGFVWRQWLFISSIVGAVVLVVTVYEFTRTPRYTAGALVLLEPQRVRPLKEDAILDPNLNYNMVESQIAIIKSTVFMRRVADKLHIRSGIRWGRPGRLGRRAHGRDVCWQGRRGIRAQHLCYVR